MNGYTGSFSYVRVSGLRESLACRGEVRDLWDAVVAARGEAASPGMVAALESRISGLIFLQKHGLQLERHDGRVVILDAMEVREIISATNDFRDVPLVAESEAAS